MNEMIEEMNHKSLIIILILQFVYLTALLLSFITIMTACNTTQLRYIAFFRFSPKIYTV